MMANMIRHFGDIPPLTSNTVGIQSLANSSVLFPDGTLELLASEHPALQGHDVQAIYALPETEEWHIIRYRAVNDRHHGTILVRLYDTDDQQIALNDAVNAILKELGEHDRIPHWVASW